jgi:hypothetical protein
MFARKTGQLIDQIRCQLVCWRQSVAEAGLPLVGEPPCDCSLLFMRCRILIWLRVVAMLCRAGENMCRREYVS